VQLFTRANPDAAERLVEVTTAHGMTVVLPPGIPTLKALTRGNLTSSDNIFSDETRWGYSTPVTPYPHTGR
jgi:hypothetical protein